MRRMWASYPRVYKAGMMNLVRPSGARRRGLLVWLAAGPLLAACAPAGDAVTLDTARAELEAGRAVVFDIREPAEHATGVAPGMRLLPMSQLGSRLGEIPADPSQPVLLICNTQNRSRKVADALRERGLTNVRHVQGGMSDWASRGWPMVPPSAASR